MPIIGSSYVRKTVIEKLVGYTGPTGPTGITGATGATGATGYGATGATGFSITGITKQNNLLITTSNYWHDIMLFLEYFPLLLFWILDHQFLFLNQFPILRI